MSTEKNKRLAELLGLSPFPNDPGNPGGRWCIIIESEGAADWKYLPNYCSDLNAVHAVWEALAPAQKRRHHVHLMEQFGLTEPYFTLPYASALQRTDALIKTLEAKE